MFAIDDEQVGFEVANDARDAGFRLLQPLCKADEQGVGLVDAEALLDDVKGAEADRKGIHRGVFVDRVDLGGIFVEVLPRV